MDNDVETFAHFMGKSSIDQSEAWDISLCVCIAFFNQKF